MNKITCTVTAYGQERTLPAREEGGKESIIRDIELREVNKNAVVADDYPNEFVGYFIGHIDDAVLKRAVEDRSPWDVELRFRKQLSKNGQFSMQKVRVMGITAAGSVYNG